MAIKIKKSINTFNKQTGKTTTEHFYIKDVSDKELEEMSANEYTKPKVKQKIRNELTRRRK